MHRPAPFFSVLTLAALMAGCATSGATTAAAPVAPPPAAMCAGYVSAGPDADEIRRLERRGAAVNVEGWTIEEARAFFAPEWISVGPDGSVTGLDAVLSQFANGRSQPWASRFDLTELDVRVYCDMAIVVGRGEAWPPGAAADSPPRVRFRYINIWRKINGAWRYTAQQFARF